MKKSELTNWLQEIYTVAKKDSWTFKEIVTEIITSGFNNGEITFLIKKATLNKTFNIK